ncbi:outer capsid protein VP4 [Striga asiatica]|uniref:Outer capsid protein VP4 n=1 Tax=Striga asiatica TaxID=4170 RepID=A0A5A7RC60_STRAF|nr:outer capsid protein VP4 [Striga asiatica]
MGVTEELRWAAAKLASLGRLAVDLAVSESLKGGMQVYAIVKGKPKSQPLSDKSNSKNEKNLVLVQEMQAKLGKMREDMNNITQQSEVSALRKSEQEHPKSSFDDPLKSLMPEPTGRKKDFHSLTSIENTDKEYGS